MAWQWLLNGFSLMAAEGRPMHLEPWEVYFEKTASPVMEKMVEFHDFLLVMCIVISVFVMGLLTYVCLRFRQSSNPVASKTTHHTLLEIIWTSVPVLILLVIAIPSFRLLFYSGGSPDPDLTIKVVGHQWYWSYEYPDHGGFGYDSTMVEDKDLKPGQFRLLEVDHPIVVPVDRTVRVQLTAADVIHAFAVPAFGIKKDAMPGRLNETWFKADKLGTYYGQCSELCGVRHGFMPIKVQVVSEADFLKWVEGAKQGSYAAYGEQVIAAKPAEAPAPKAPVKAPVAAEQPAAKPAPAVRPAQETQPTPPAQPAETQQQAPASGQDKAE
ncbi:MAG: cytochrome c oxidase subunit II [Alphaproteobacteria bacterium]|nr:cytochrome c oxidase subunit II [Alphaproteobacteria bacterium]